MSRHSVEVTEPFVLREDVVLIPCAELDANVREKISFDEGDFTLSRRHGRTRSQVIDGGTAALLALFRQPRTIVSAVIENSRALGTDPRARLGELLPPLAAFVEKGVLVQSGSAEQAAMRPRFESGAAIAGWETVRCVGLIEDTEVYQLRRGRDTAALKIARVTTPGIKALLKNEIAILRHLDGAAIAPRLLDTGAHESRPYLILEWIDGVDAGVAAAQRCNDRAGLIDLCASIAAAYAALHARGVLHGDVNPRNVMAGERVRLIDFGYSRLSRRRPGRRRGGVHYFFEPEYFRALRRGEGQPTTAAGEQYGVAALLYLLIAGRHYLDFRYDGEEMERQAMSDPPLPFAARGIAPWPEVERILARALEKDPARRYGSMAELAAALAAVRDATAREALSIPVSTEAAALLDATLTSFARGGEVFQTRYPAPPTASINDGCAGAAAALLRIAEARSDPALLALADVWRSRAAALAGSDGAWHEKSPILGAVSPYHCEAGLHAATAMIASARGDHAAQRRAIRAFLAASDTTCAQLDLTLGRSGSLLGAAMLLETAPDDDTALRAFGAKTMRAIWRELDARPPIAASPDGAFLGIAHGWAGYIYAALRWCAASGDPLPPRLRERLDEYLALKREKGRGVFWPNRTDEMQYGLIAGWCNGTAGLVFLFTLAHRVLGGAQWLELAERCAWNTWDEPRFAASLCCGTAGRAYALLNLYKTTGAAEWLSRARQLANHAAGAAASTENPNSLLKGALGVAVLVADLASPENARMPFFE